MGPLDFCILIFIFVKLFQLHPESSGGHNVEQTAVVDNFHCLLYPTNMLNCSWSFPTLQKESQLFVYIRYSFVFKQHIIKNGHIYNHGTLKRINSFECVSLSLSIHSACVTVKQQFNL